MVVGALLILAVGILIVVGIERNTARAFADRQRAGLAAIAGLNEVRGILTTEAANDDFLVLQDPGTAAVGATKTPSPYLYLARGSGGGNAVSYRYVPMFSTESLPAKPAAGSPLKAPDSSSLIGAAPKQLDTLPWLDSTKVSWVNVKDSAGKVVSRYAYWVEDLQGRVDAKVSGNVDGPGGIPARSKFPDPAAKPVSETTPLLSPLSIHVLDPKATEKPTVSVPGVKSLTQRVVDGRPAMISPDSVIGATDVLGDSKGTAMTRNSTTGLLTQPVAAALERSVSSVNQPYLEQPVVPFSPGLSVNVTGKPKLNLNQLLTGSRGAAVDKMADWISTALPDFKDRKGGFPAPDDYVKTLAAGAMDYADADSDPTISPGSYIGLDAYPLLSEIVLHINFIGRGQVKTNGVLRYVLFWQFKLFAELWNPTNQPVTGSARLSYEVNLKPVNLGVSGSLLPFDDPSILQDKNKSTHTLTQIGNKFYSDSKPVTLGADEYVFYEFANVNYTLDYPPQFKSDGTPQVDTFDLVEQPNEARGITLRWGDQPVQTIQGIVRDAYGVENFSTATPRKAAKAAIPGHSYGPHGSFVNNMGDTRIAGYLRTTRLGENAYPENISPGRRNIRRKTIYDIDPLKEKRHIHGRVLPSEWPDGGHDSPTGTITVVTDNSILPTNSSTWPADSIPAPLAANAPQRISNLGRFYSATELGRVYDPILWKPTYKDIKGDPGSGKKDTDLLFALKPTMPSTRNGWPEVSFGSSSSSEYGGGNTLRIGRPEHERFDTPGKRAGQLLDLFHVGIPASTLIAKREGVVAEIKGNVNVNTADKDALRTLAAGLLEQDPKLCRVTSWEHDTSSLFSAKTTPLELGSPTTTLVADQIADALMLRRPFASPSEMAAVLDKDGVSVFGNRDSYKNLKDIQWSDAAAEELFARVYDASTVRSRNFRVWVIGQALAGTEVLAEHRKVFTLFSDPGVRKVDGSIDPAKHIPKVTYENDF